MGQTNAPNHKRLIFVALFIFFNFATLILQFYKVQIIEGEKWTKIARSQHEKLVREPSMRGKFYSNTSIKEGHIEKPQSFVTDIPRYHLFIDPQVIPKSCRKEMRAKLSSILDCSKDEEVKMASHFEKQSRSRRLWMWLERDKKHDIEQWWRLFARQNKIPQNGVFFVKDYRRSYPFGKLLGQVLHTIRDDRDILTGHWIPTGGIEMQFDEYLRGKDGKKIIERSPKQPLETDRIIEQPIDGADVYLTINHYLQAICEEELEKGIHKVGAKSGWAVVMDPKTGEILALGQYPFFDPSDYRAYYNHPDQIEETKIKAITNVFEPGSTAKAISIAIALLANEELRERGEKILFSPNEMIRCDDNVFPGRSKPIKDVRTHRYLNMHMAIQKSSNVYVARIIERVVNRMGVEWYRDKLENTFGLGKLTGIELPGETPGLIPRPGKTHPNGHLEWSTPTPFSLAMGYNLLTNSVQMLRAFAIFANGGYLVQPTILRKIESAPVTYFENNQREFQQVLPTKIAHEVTDALKFVTKPGGAAPAADVFGFTEAGKSGTSEKIVNHAYSTKTHFTSFIGFVPAEEARLVIIVCVDEPKSKYIPGLGTTHYGGKSAGPIFREVARRSLQYLGVTPDDPYGFGKGDPRSDMTQADWMNEVAKLQEQYEAWNQ
ncbi:MAG: putative peptidoglycan D,D-transpeptidase PenA [Chlamydiia bacterium]|nr:putative peptidoglycan D,D-transpeptidase PenA [Chlamydiia bacterium]